MAGFLKVFIIFTFTFFLIITIPGESLSAEEPPGPDVEITVDRWGNVVVRTAGLDNSTVIQYGSFNLSVQLDSDLASFSEVLQTGEMNFSVITQEGEDNKAKISQSGKDNTAVIKQSSSNEEDKEEE